MRTTIVLAAIAVTACRGHHAPSREERASAALARVADIQQRVAIVRGLGFVRPVAASRQSTVDLRANLRSDLDVYLPPARAQARSAALFHLGFMTKPVDIARAIEDAWVAQAVAYYDPRVKQFFLVQVPDLSVLEMVCAHELTHALQDQNFDLRAYLPPDLDDDAATARKFVIEGDATLTMMLYPLARNAIAVSPRMIERVRPAIEQLAAMDVAEIDGETKAQMGVMGLAGDEEVQRARDAIDAVPPTIEAPLVYSYGKGARVALAAYDAGGWPAVDALYRVPPRSTEQVLHPVTKLYPLRDEPRPITFAPSDGQDVYANTLGELQWSIYFGLWTPPLAKNASEGWGGDRYRVVRRKDGRLVGEIATVWDSEDDAVQFESAYVASLAKRFPGATGDAAHGLARPDGGKVFVRRDRDRVFIVDGADDVGALDALAQGSTID